MKIIKFPSGVLVIILLAIFNSCTCHREERIPLDSMDVTVEVKRFDHDLFSIDLDSIEKEVERLDSSYGEFFALFTEGIIGIGLPDNPSYNNYLSSFVTDNMVSETYRKVQSTFPDDKQLNRTLTNRFLMFMDLFLVLITPLCWPKGLLALGSIATWEVTVNTIVCWVSPNIFSTICAPKKSLRIW